MARPWRSQRATFVIASSCDDKRINQARSTCCPPLIIRSFVRSLAWHGGGKLKEVERSHLSLRARKMGCLADFPRMDDGLILRTEAESQGT